MYDSTAKAISHYKDKQKFTETPNFGRKLFCCPSNAVYRSILLLDSHGFCQVAGFIDIATLIYGDVISEQLQRYRGNDRR